MGPDPFPGSHGGVGAGPTAGVPPHRPSQGPRWFLPVLVAAGAVLVGWALLFAAAERNDRDQRVDDLTDEFTDGCDP